MLMHGIRGNYTTSISSRAILLVDIAAWRRPRKRIPQRSRLLFHKGGAIRTESFETFLREWEITGKI